MKNDEWGVFCDDGLLEGGFPNEATANEAISDRYADDVAHAGVICRDHPEHEEDACEECSADADEHATFAPAFPRGCT